MDPFNRKHMMTVTLSGITTCDTVRKARAWLDQHGVAYRFHDFRIEGLEAKRLAGWVDALGWETVLNRAGRASASSPRPTASTSTGARRNGSFSPIRRWSSGRCWRRTAR